MVEYSEQDRLEIVRQRLYSIIDTAGAHGVSDIHVHPVEGIWVVRSGELRKDNREAYRISEAEIRDWLFLGSDDDATDPLGEQGHCSVALDTGTFRVRAAFRRSTTGLSVTFRLIPRTIPTPESLGVPREMQSMVRKPAGLILIEGPTGSGKTTTIASLIEQVAHERDVHTYLVEDPIEFVHPPAGNSVFTQREIGIHAYDYPSAVENALRSKPNIIVIGELLNLATIRSALHAASTGHLVLTTAHAGSVVEAIDGLIGQFPTDEQNQIRSRLSETLLGVLVQRLVPATGGALTPVREVLTMNPNFQDLIKEGKMHMLHGQLEGNAPGSFSLESDMLSLIRSGTITVETAMEQTRKDEQFRANLEREGLK